MTNDPQRSPDQPLPPQEVAPDHDTSATPPTSITSTTPAEVGGRKGLEPTRYGDWEFKGRCIDF